MPDVVDAVLDDQEVGLDLGNKERQADEVLRGSGSPHAGVHDLDTPAVEPGGEVLVEEPFESAAEDLLVIVDSVRIGARSAEEDDSNRVRVGCERPLVPKAQMIVSEAIRARHEPLRWPGWPPTPSAVSERDLTRYAQLACRSW